MEGDLFKSQVEDPRLAGVPADPDIAADVLGENVVRCLGHFDEGVAMDTTLDLGKTGKEGGR